jgi:CRP/FNR family transcriptional regulator, cyclic AMP receptor protein
MSKAIAELIDGLEFFRDFGFAELTVLSHYFGYLEAADGEVIFREGEPGNYMLVLIEGRMAVHKSADGAPHLLCYESSGRIVGEMALLDRERRSATCVAVEPCRLVTLSNEGLQQLAGEHPGLAYRFMYSVARLLSRRLRRTSGVLAEHLVD